MRRFFSGIFFPGVERKVRFIGQSGRSPGYGRGGLATAAAAVAAACWSWPDPALPRGGSVGGGRPNRSVRSGRNFKGMLGHLKPRPNAARARHGGAGPLWAGAPAALAGTSPPPEVSGGSVAVGLSPFALARRCGGGRCPPVVPALVRPAGRPARGTVAGSLVRPALSAGSLRGCSPLPVSGRPWALSLLSPGPPPATCPAALLPRLGAAAAAGRLSGGVPPPGALGLRLRACGPGPGSGSGSGSW